MRNCRLTQQRTTYRLYEVSQMPTRQNTMSVILHVGVRQSTSLRWLTDHNKQQRRVTRENTGVGLKWERRRHLEKLLSVVCRFCPLRWGRACRKHKPRRHRPAVIVQQQWDVQSTLWRSWEQAQNGEAMFFRILPSLKHTHLYTGMMLTMTNILRLTSPSAGLTHGYTHKMVLARFGVFGEESLARQGDNRELIGLAVASTTHFISVTTIKLVQDLKLILDDTKKPWKSLIRDTSCGQT